MTLKENKASFLARIKPRLAPSDVRRIRGAYYMAKYGHRAQVRKGEKDENGNPRRYFEHVRRAAIVLMDEAHVFDRDLIITCLLHDTLEDCEDIDAEIIEDFYGKEVARRVTILTKDPEEGYLERLAQADEQTILCKACDRLDNLRSLKECSPEFQAKQVKETVEKYRHIFYVRLGEFHPVVVAMEKVLAELRSGR